jgi:hypothetical protein
LVAFDGWESFYFLTAFNIHMKTAKPTNPGRRRLLKIAGIALGAASVGTGVAVATKAMLAASRGAQRAHRIQVAERAKDFRALGVKQPERQRAWARISLSALKWDPVNPQDRTKIDFVNGLSERLGISPERVLLTLKVNELDSQGNWVTKYEFHTRELKRNTQQFAEPGKVKSAKRTEEVQSGERARAKRVIEILDEARRNSGLTAQIQEDLKKLNPQQIESLGKD